MRCANPFTVGGKRAVSTVEIRYIQMVVWLSKVGFIIVITIQHWRMHKVLVPKHSGAHRFACER